MHGYAELGFDAAYIGVNEVRAIGAALTHGMPQANVYGWSRGLLRRGTLDHYHAIIIDDVGEIDASEGDPVELIAQRFAGMNWRPTIIAFYTKAEGVDGATA
ncbi:hypothetical protein ABLT15_26805 [Paraburkholderia tropica]|uniref:hypothetical protein n=1 Tax=Paraburkholderia tropica TaxID=92647 RepID=UPI0032B5E462